MALVYLSIAWVIGVYLGSRFLLPWSVIFAGLAPLIFIPFFLRYKKQLILACFCLLCLFGGSIRFQTSLPVVNEHSLQFYNDGGIIMVEGTVCTEPEPGNTTSSFQISAAKVQTGGDYINASGKALVNVLRYPEYHYGDMLRITGKLQTPSESRNDFNYRDYLARQGVYSIISYPRIKVIDTGKGIKPLAWIYSLRENLSLSLSQALPEPQAAMAQGILLGMRGNIPDSLNQAFSRTGTAHLLAISGINITIIIGMILAAGIWLFGKRHSIYIWLTLLIIWLYALLTGMNPPVIRAAIMGSLFLIAELLGRQSSALIALTFAAAIMVGIDPQILWQASFQLSFLAMTGLILISPYVRSWGMRGVSKATDAKSAPASAGIFAVNSFAITLAAILATWPIIAYYFHVVSFVGLPATFFAALALPPIIITTAVVAIVGLLIPVLAQVLGWISWLVISYFILVVRIFDALPFSSIKLESIESWQIWAYYACLAVVVTAVYYHSRLTGLFHVTRSRISPYLSRASNSISKVPKKWIISPLLITAIIVWVAVLNMPDEKLHVSILDVGQGDAILIQTPNRQDILIDGGPSPKTIDLELSKRMPFWDRTIDLVILTQPQADHVSGLIEVLQNYKVTQVYEPGIDYASSTYRQWLGLIEAKEIRHENAKAGQQINLGDGMKLDVLNPPSPFLQGTSDDVDNNGIALRLSWNEISFLFTADLGKEAEWQLIAQRANLNSTVLKVGHHGSLTSTSEQFLAAVNPQIAVISVGADNRFGLPSSEIIDRLSRQVGNDGIYLTSTRGTIEIITDGHKLWLKHDR
jgi:competence protein ComEC